jgi:hypothetical protein
MENSFEHAFNTSYYLQHPEWFVHGVKASMCFISCGQLILENSFYEGIVGAYGGTPAGYYDCLAHVIDTFPTNIRQDGAGQSLFITSQDTDQAMSNAGIAYMGRHLETSEATGGVPANVYNSITAITRASNGEITTLAPHGFTTDQYVRCYNMQSMLQIDGLRLKITVNGANTFLTNIDTTSFSVFSNLSVHTGPGNKAINEPWYLDVTDERNYRVGYRGKKGFDSLVFIEDPPYTGRLYFADHIYPYTSRDTLSMIRNCYMEMYAVPTMPATAREGMKVTELTTGGPNSVAVARIRHVDPENGAFSFANVKINQKEISYYDTRTNSGSWQNQAGGISTWSTGAVKKHTVDLNYYLGDSTQVIPTTHNGFVYQCKIGGTTHASTQPTWITAIATDFLISAITAANPPQVTTTTPHGFANGTKIVIEEVRGMTEVNAVIYTVASTASTTFTLSGITGAGYTTYTGGGIVYAVNDDNGVAWKCIRTTTVTGDASNITVEDGRQVKYASAAPTTGRWAVGDRVWNSAPTAGHFGWICSVAGLPGTWVEMT